MAVTSHIPEPERVVTFWNTALWKEAVSHLTMGKWDSPVIRLLQTSIYASIRFNAFGQFCWPEICFCSFFALRRKHSLQTQGFLIPATAFGYGSEKANVSIPTFKWLQMGGGLPAKSPVPTNTNHCTDPPSKPERTSSGKCIFTSTTRLSGSLKHAKKDWWEDPATRGEKST